MKMVAPTYVAATEGKKAARHLPKSKSSSVVGVAKSGSRLFSTFSPMKL